MIPQYRVYPILGMQLLEMRDPWKHLLRSIVDQISRKEDYITFLSIDHIYSILYFFNIIKTS